MALVLWYAESSQAVRDLARSLLMDNKLQLLFWESFKFPEVEPHDLVLVLGDKMKPVLEVPKCIPKNRTISSLREKVHSCPQLPHFMITYHPSIQDVDHAKGVEVVCDFQLAKRFAMTGSLDPQLGDYQYPDSLKEFRAEVEALYEQTGKPVPVSFDLETLGVNQFDPSAYILNLSLSHTERTATALSFTPLTQPHPTDPTSLEGQIWWDLHWLLNSNHVSIRGANLKFDLIWVSVKWGITCTNFKFDTLLVGSLLDENRSNSLKVHAKVYTDLGSYSDAFDQKYDKGRMDLIPEDERLLYAASDADATLRVAKIESELLQSNPMLTRFYVKVLHPAARAFEKVEQCGVYVDPVKYQQLQAEVENALDVYEQKALACVPRRLIAKWGDKASLTKAHFLADYMFSPTGLGLTPKKFTLKTNAPSTAMDHFEMFGDDERAKPFVEQLKAFNSAKKTLSTYIVGFLKHLQPDGRFHPTYFLASQGDTGGTVSGRLSAKDPAVQCMTGDTLVLTDKGNVPLAQLVSRYEMGEDFIVLTHTGIWQRLIGVFHNGIQPVFRVSSGHTTIRSTGNHPVLTKRGWVRTDKLIVGDTIYAYQGERYTAQDSRIHKSDVLQLGCHEEQVYKPNKQGLAEVWGQGDNGLHRMDGIQELPCRHGGEAFKWDVHREVGCERELRAGELHLGRPDASGIKQEEYKIDNSQGGDQDGSPVGTGRRYYTREATLPFIEGDSDGISLDEGSGVELRIFQETVITGISYAGEELTYDLTIEGSHSFVANGIVVHNTLPKHTLWAKKLRKCFVAPPGYVILGPDYSQGELKIAACLANEPTMIDSYSKGIDLHAVTASGIAGWELEEFMALKDVDPDKYDEVRQLGKAGNFGLIYGMGAKGFQIYAETSYGVVMTLEQAEEARNKFFNTYPLLLEWHKLCKSHARRYKQIHSPLGRVRHLPLIHSPIREVAAKSERQCVNSPVQSTLSDMSLWATALMDKEYGMDVNGFCVIGMIHDQLLAYAPEDEAELWAGRMKEVMENLPFHEVDWEPQLKFTVDMTIGYNLADLKKWSKPGDWQPEGV